MAKKKIAVSLLSALMSMHYANATVNGRNNIDFLPIQETVQQNSSKQNQSMIDVKSEREQVKTKQVEKDKQSEQVVRGKKHPHMPTYYVDSLDEVISTVKSGKPLIFERNPSDPTHLREVKEATPYNTKVLPNQIRNRNIIDTLDKRDRERLAEMNLRKGHHNWVQMPNAPVKDLPPIYNNIVKVECETEKEYDVSHNDKLLNHANSEKFGAVDTSISINEDSVQDLINFLDRNQEDYYFVKSDLEDLKYNIFTEGKLRSLQQNAKALHKENLRRFEESKKKELMNILKQFDQRKQRDLEDMKTKHNSEEIHFQQRMQQNKAEKDRILSNLIQKLHN